MTQSIPRVRVLDKSLGVVDSQLDDIYHRIVGDSKTASADGVYGVFSHTDQDFVD
jgi:hypothetical protein